jgi:hypothetical protein
MVRQHDSMRAVNFDGANSKVELWQQQQQQRTTFREKLKMLQ